MGPNPPPIQTEDETEDSDWDQDEAEWLVGKVALVSVTTMESDGETVKSQAQYHGKIVSADRNMGIAIACEGSWAGKTMTLPPTTSAFEPADPGDYKLHSTGDVVEDPDVLARWTVTEPVKS